MTSLLSRLIDVGFEEKTIEDAQHRSDRRQLRVVAALLRDKRLRELEFDVFGGVSTVTGANRYSIGIWHGHGHPVASLIFYVDDGVIASRSAPYSGALETTKSYFNKQALRHDYLEIQQAIAEFVVETKQSHQERKAV